MINFLIILINFLISLNMGVALVHSLFYISDGRQLSAWFAGASVVAGLMLLFQKIDLLMIYLNERTE